MAWLGKLHEGCFAELGKLDEKCFTDLRKLHEGVWRGKRASWKAWLFCFWQHFSRDREREGERTAVTFFLKQVLATAG